MSDDENNDGTDWGDALKEQAAASTDADWGDALYEQAEGEAKACLLYTSPSPRD